MEGEGDEIKSKQASKEICTTFRKEGFLKKHTCRGDSIISKFSSKQSCQLGQGETPGFWYKEKYKANASYQYHTVSTEKVI